MIFQLIHDSLYLFKLDPNDSLGDNICIDCAQKFSDFYTFRLMFMESQKQLNEYQKQYTKDECYGNQMDDGTNTDLLVDPFSEIQDCMMIWQCNNCFKVFQRETELNAHILIHENDEQNAFNDQAIHITSESTDNITNNINDQNYDENWRWVCNRCDNRFPRREDLRKHRRQRCNRENTVLMPNIKKLKNDKSKELTKAEQCDSMNDFNCGSITNFRWKCTRCIVSFRTRDLLRDHNRRHKYKHFIFNTSYDTDDSHGYIEPNESKPIIITGASTMKEEQSNDLKQSKVNISIDNVMIKNETEPSKLRNRHNERDWDCSSCGAVFNRRQLLRDHRRLKHTSNAGFTLVKEEPEDYDIEFFAEDYSYQDQN